MSRPAIVPDGAGDVVPVPDVGGSMAWLAYTALRQGVEERSRLRPNQPCPSPFLATYFIACLCGALCFPSLAGLCLAGQDAGQDHSPTPFSPDETQHGFSQTETMPLAPEDTTPDPLSYYRNEPPGSPGLQETAPGGLFRRITLAHNVEDELDIRRGHFYYPVHPAETFAPDTSAVYVVFQVFKHYAAYHVIGHLVPEHVPGISDETVTDEDTAALALEDESGYLKFFAPSQAGHPGWRPGRYRSGIFVCFEASALTRLGPVRFTVAPPA